MQKSTVPRLMIVQYSNFLAGASANYNLEFSIIKIKQSTFHHPHASKTMMTGCSGATTTNFPATSYTNEDDEELCEIARAIVAGREIAGSAGMIAQRIGRESKLLTLATTTNAPTMLPQNRQTQSNGPPKHQITSNIISDSHQGKNHQHTTGPAPTTTDGITTAIQCNGMMSESDSGNDSDSNNNNEFFLDSDAEGFWEAYCHQHVR